MYETVMGGKREGMVMRGLMGLGVSLVESGCADVLFWSKAGFGLRGEGRIDEFRIGVLSLVRRGGVDADMTTRIES